MYYESGDCDSTRNSAPVHSLRFDVAHKTCIAITFDFCVLRALRPVLKSFNWKNED